MLMPEIIYSKSVGKAAYMNFIDKGTIEVNRFTKNTEATIREKWKM